MDNVYYDANNDMLYNTAMEVSTNTKARIGGFLGGMKFGLIEPIARFIDTTISLLARAIAVTVPNSKVIWVSKEFPAMMKNAKITKVVGYYKIIADVETTIDLVKNATELQEELEPIMKNIHIGFTKSDETPIKITMGEFKKSAGSIMKYFKALKTTVGMAAVTTKTLSRVMKDDKEAAAKYKASTDSLKAIYKCSSVINRTIVKTLVSAMFLAKKDNEKGSESTPVSAIESDFGFESLFI